MKIYQFQNILQKDGWTGEVYITVGEDKKITAIEKEKPEGEIFPQSGALIPGFKNAHSHAFQFAMAGLNESIPTEADGDDFWSWRENMYSLALELSPDEMQKIATDLYTEMRRYGYSHVAEFHYLHHDKEGNPYSNMSEMGERLMVAAATAGIKLTLIPMFYQMGGFNLDPNPKQRRFLSKTLDDYLELLESTKESAKKYDDIIIGAGVHSLRAVKTDDIIELFKTIKKDNIPKHLHISEQVKEVVDCMSHLKKRPVQWLCENIPMDENFNLVHATHLVSSEIDDIIKSKANVVLCPSTEANLGDGLFPLLEFHQKGGRFSIGTDSHVGLSPMEELRWLDYGVRLTEMKRNPLCKGGESSGEILFHEVQETGLKSMGLSSENYFVVGEKLQGVLINTDHVLFENKPDSALINTLIYSAGREHISVFT